MNGNSVSLLRTIRGPILLIALGSLAAIDNFMGISFTKTWPALLILAGLLKLMERLTLRPPSPPTQPFMGGGS